MVADCGATCAKYILCLFNFVFFVVGTAVLGVGVWLAVDTTSFITLTKLSQINATIGNEGRKFIHELQTPSVIEQGAYILIAAGAFIFIISFLGYCGAIKESRVLLTAYGLFIIIIAILQIAAIVVGVALREPAETQTKEFFHHTIRKYYTTSERRDAVTLSWDFMQAELQCCGVESYKDFEKATNFIKYTREEQSGQVIPESCCILKDSQSVTELFIAKDKNCLTSPTTYNSYMNTGCYETVKNSMTANLNIVVGVAASILALQILGIIFSFCLCKAIGNDRDYHYKY